MAFTAGGVGGTGIATQYNFIAASKLHRPDVDSELALRYGSQSLIGLMALVGSEVLTEANEYEHFEEDYIMPKVKATTAGALAGAQATFTIDATAKVTKTFANSPHTSTVTKDTVPVLVGDTILIKSGTSRIKARVDGVAASGATFTAVPLKSGDVIPAIAAAEDIVIYGNLFGEGSGQPQGRTTKTLRFLNNLQIMKHTYKLTGTEENMRLWIEVNGSPFWSAKGEADTYKMHTNHVELGLLLGEKITNLANIINPAATADEPILGTEGLIPFVQSQGNDATYAGPNFTLADFKALVLNLDKAKGSRHNMIHAGIALSLGIDEEIKKDFGNATTGAGGGINYGMFKFNEEQRVALNFSTFQLGEYVFHKRTYDAFNDAQTLGAGVSFTNEGIVAPMDDRTITYNGNRMSVPSLRIRYTNGRKPKTTITDMFEVDGKDVTEVRYLSECGFEGIAGNRWAYMKK